MSNPSYINFKIINNTQQNSTNCGLSDKDIYLFFTQEAENLTWSINTSTGIATPNSAGVLAPSVTLADIPDNVIKVDSSISVSSARIYFSNSPTAVTNPSGVTIAGPTAETANFYYDFVEFVLPGGSGNLNIDITQVDQLGIPMTLQVSPADPNFQSGSGILPQLDRATLISNFESMATGELAAFQDCIFSDPNDPSVIYRLLNPADVLSARLNATSLQGSITTSGCAGDWQAIFTITGPIGSNGTPPTNASLSPYMEVNGPFIPAGMQIGSIPDFPNGQTVMLNSLVNDNPFTACENVTLHFMKPITTPLSTYFDNAIDNFFNYYLNSPGTLKIEQNSSGTDYTYVGNVTEIGNVPNIEGGTSSYTVLQFTGGNNEIYNIYYPFFTTNSPYGKTTPSGGLVPPPPSWWAPEYGLMSYEPPSMMVFGASGVFADNTQQSSYAPPSIRPSNGTILGAIENVIVSALVRGHATTWQFLEGTITDATSTTPYTAEVNLSNPYTTANLNNGMYMYSYQIANIPMSIDIPATATTEFQVSSPLKILPTTADLLTFANFYPIGGTWSAFANFLHNGAGYNIMIDGRAYALPFDDQGGFSSDLNSVTSLTDPASVTITLAPWSPSGSSNT